MLTEELIARTNCVRKLIAGSLHIHRKPYKTALHVAGRLGGQTGLVQGRFCHLLALCRHFALLILLHLL